MVRQNILIKQLAKSAKKGNRAALHTLIKATKSKNKEVAKQADEALKRIEQ